MRNARERFDCTRVTVNGRSSKERGSGQGETSEVVDGLLIIPDADDHPPSDDLGRRSFIDN